jgi:hypothetical protein
LIGNGNDPAHETSGTAFKKTGLLYHRRRIKGRKNSAYRFEWAIKKRGIFFLYCMNKGQSKGAARLFGSAYLDELSISYFGILRHDCSVRSGQDQLEYPLPVSHM